MMGKIYMLWVIILPAGEGKLRKRGSSNGTGRNGNDLIS
jgi:hypothetical protein